MHAPLTPDETTRYASRGLSDADLAGEAALAPTVARRAAEGLVAKGLLGRTGSLYRPIEIVD
jgi:hypothetical protein